jgi:hypothetical protein
MKMNFYGRKVEQIFSWGDVKFPNDLNPTCDPDFLYPEPSVNDMVFSVNYTIYHPDPRLFTAMASVLAKLSEDKLKECSRLFDSKSKRVSGFLLETFNNKNWELFYQKDLFSEEANEFLFLSELSRPHWAELRRKQANEINLKWGVLGTVCDPNWYANGKLEWIKSQSLS